MNRDSWVKIYRKMMSWEWYKDISCKVIFLHLILNVQHKETHYCGIILKKGQTITTIRKLAKETGLSFQQTRTALTKLQKTNDIFIQKTKSFSIISLNNWQMYQGKIAKNNGEDSSYNAFA